MATTTVPRSVSEYRRAYRVYTLLLAAAGVFLVAHSLQEVGRLPEEYLLLAALSVVGHLFLVLDLAGGMRLSLQPVLAAVWLYGWEAGSLLFLLTAPLVLRSSRDPWRALVYFGGGTLWVFGAGLVFEQLRSPATGQLTWQEVGAFLASGGVFVAGYLLTTAVGRYLATGDPEPLRPRGMVEAGFLLFAGHVPLAYLLLLALRTGPAAGFLGTGVWLLTAVALKGSVQTHRANQELQRAIRELEFLSVVDPLTGLWNRRHFVHVLPREILRHSRTGQPLSLLVVDLRSLKQINDTYGHEAGDRALQLAAEVFRHRLRASDWAFRIGGDEFALLLPDTDTHGASTVASDILQLLATRSLDAAPGARLEATVGVATYPQHGLDPDGLVAAADSALYRARERGSFVASCD